MVFWLWRPNANYCEKTLLIKTMKRKLSVLMITKNSAEILEESLSSIKNLADEIIIVDDFSTDKTTEIAREHKAKIFLHSEEDLGKQKAYGLSKTKGEWIFALDSDEIVSKKLSLEILKRLSEKNLKYDGFIISYQNHFLGKKVNFGGENYRILRLFKKTECIINPRLLHEKFEVKGKKISILKNKIYHYSYRSIIQIYKKFTDYGRREAKQKIKNNEKTSAEKIIFYPLHMFWARFFKDNGYKDGLFRLPLDIGFAYMEFLSYFLMLFIKNKNEDKFN